jgi:hypothetical protein
MSVGAAPVPVLILIVLKGLPKLSAAPFMTNPVRLTLPTTSLAPEAGPEVAAAGIVSVNAPVSKSLLVSVNAPLTVAFPVSVTPVTWAPMELLIVRLL